MPIPFTDSNNHKHFLDDDVTNNPTEIERLNKIYANKAKKLARESGKDIFYSLLAYNKSQYTQGNFFIIPIEEKDTELIMRSYSKEYFIGIAHHHK